MSESGPAMVTADAWVVTTHGNPTSVVERRAVEVPAPGPNEVRVAVDAFCLNLNDIDIIRGRYATLMLEPPFVPGMESVGQSRAPAPAPSTFSVSGSWVSRSWPTEGMPPTPWSMRPPPWSYPAG